jgi:tRNA (guanine37-N1)-methyltransferase
MRSRALIVPRTRGEAALRDLREAEWLRTDLAIRAEGAVLLLPIVARAAMPPSWGEVAEREFDPRPVAGPTDYRDLVRWSAEDRRRLPRSFDVIGDVVLVRLPPELEPRRAEVGEALLAFVPGARIVGWDRGVHGPERRRRIERIAGTGSWSTRHRENGLELLVDVERAYFSPRLAREHARVAEAVQAGDRVYDLCCGVGPFSVAIARDRRARSIVAVDSNPAAIELLEGTLARVAYGNRVSPVLGSVEEFLPGREPVERVILNLPHEGIKHLASAASAVAPGGCLYYYEVVPRVELGGRADVIATGLPRGPGWEVVPPHVVHPYSPASDLIAFVFARRAA